MSKWQPGRSGNPKGRPPKGRSLSDMLAKAGEGKLSIAGDKHTFKQVLARQVWHALLTGEVPLFDPATGAQKGQLVMQDVGEWARVAKLLYDQVDGPPRAAVELTGADGGPLQIASVEPLPDDTLDAILKT